MRAECYLYTYWLLTGWRVTSAPLVSHTRLAHLDEFFCNATVSHYHTVGRELTAYTLHSLSTLRVTLVFFQVCLRVSQHLPMQMQLLLSSGRSSYFRMVFCSFHFLPIFLLAQILMRADLGDEPEHPLEVVISNPPGQDATRTPQLTGNVGQRSLHSARISEETRTADTATLCQTQKVSLTETRTRVLANGGQAPNQLHHRGSHGWIA